MQTTEQNQLRDLMTSRHSIRKYRTDHKISREELTRMIKEASSAPSSGNLQPWRVVVVDSEEGKAKLRPLVMFNTLQNDTSSAMILILADTQHYKQSDYIFNKAVDEGKMPADVRDRQLELINAHYPQLPASKLNEIVKIDSALFAMQFMLIAKSYGYDTSPMGGFEEERVVEAFDLDPEQYSPVMILALGKADEAGYESVRLTPEQITFWH
ncbi:nitroreductase family protein [Saccharibacillus sacchari]|uniref:Nitroreductase family protein n=1 Tax=Saccharibacillus sacchari TaxID=456493 RepID=A0ACC6PA99_9BACL